MLSPYRWLLRSMSVSSKPRRVKQRGLSLIENLESRQLLTTIFSENFEGGFEDALNGWSVNTSQNRNWDDNEVIAHTGTSSGFSANNLNGSDNSTYLSNMDSIFSRTVDLSNFRDVTLSYYRYFNIEDSGFDYDTFQVSVFKAGVGSVSSPVLSGDFRTWTQDTLQIPQSLYGQSGVTVRFRFTSDGSIIGENQGANVLKGVWVDDISMDGTNDVGFPESTITVPQGAVLRLNQFGDITNVSNSITSAADTDVWGFGVNDTGNYTITIDGAVGFDAELRIYDDAGNAITNLIDVTGSGGIESITVNRPSGGACYIVVAGYTSSTGNYTLSVNGPSSGTGGTISVPSPTYSGNGSESIHFAGDRDYFNFTAPLDTTTVSIALSNSANLDGFITLFDSNGVQLTTADTAGDGGVDNLTDYPVVSGQTYVLMISGFDLTEGSGGAESYSFTVDFDPDNVGNPPSQISVPSGVNLRLNQFGNISGVADSIVSTVDFDTFGFSVETTGTYTISASGIDTQLRVYDSNGNAITNIQDADNLPGQGETLNINLTAGTTCYFVVGGFNSTTGAFTVSVDGPSVVVAATNFAAPNYNVVGGGSISGAGDRDYFNLTAPAGTNLLSITLSPSANLDGVISLFDAAGVLLQQKDAVANGGAESIANFAVTAGQNYYVMFSGDSITEGSAGAESYNYTLDFGPDLVDINVAPTIPADQDLPIAENSPTNTVVGQVVANDANSTAPNNVLTYQIVSQSPSTQFSINANTGVITYIGPGPLNFETVPQFTLSVKVTDGGALFATQNVTISVTDVNETPTIQAGQTLQVLENSALNTVVGSVLADDPDNVAPNSMLTYSIVSGNPSNPFSINPATGQITVANPAALNFETTPQFTLQVKVTDGGAGNLNATQSVVINLIDANDAPTINAGQIFSIAENSGAGAAVGTVLASDPDTTAPNKTLSYSITGGNTNTAFAINPTTGAITVNNPSALDFEANQSFALTVTVTDGGALQVSQGVVVNLTNVNETPSVVAGQNFSIAENSAQGTVLGAVVAIDPDANKALTYSITGGNTGNAFTIDPVTGEISIANAAAVNFETTAVFSLTVRATDSGNLFDSKTVTINVTDVNEAPSIPAGQSFNVAENSTAGVAVGTVTRDDPDTTAPNNTKTFSITGGNTGNAFAINAATGAITVNTPAALDFEATPIFNLTITVTDGGNLSANQTVVVNLTNVNEAPTLGAPGTSPTFVGKTKTAVIVFPAITVTDPDGATDLASVNITVSIPAGKKKFDVISSSGTGALGAVTGSFANGNLTITLNNGVTTAQVQNFLRSITFATSKASLKTLTRNFTVSVTDKNGAVSNLVNQTVNVHKK